MSGLPRMSVIVPAFDAAATIGRTLACLASQDLTEPYEVIVVDDGSRDGTAELAERAGVRLLRRARGGPAAARNTGAEAARAPMLAFTDADCFPTAGWLTAGLAALRHADLVQGSVEPEPGVPIRPFDRTLWVVRAHGLYESANLLMRCDLFERLGGFEDWLVAEIGKPLAEDVWLGWRARRAGARVAFCPEALVHHAVFRRGARGYVAERRRLLHFPEIAGKIPELRRELFFARVFLNRRSAAFDAALAGAATAALTRSPLPLLGAGPYAAASARRAFRWGRIAPKVAAVELAADAVGFFSLARGSLRRRTLLL